MPITTDVIIAIIGIATPLFGAAFWLGRWLDRKVKENIKTLQDQMAGYVGERQRLLTEFNARVSELERSSVSKEDYLQDREAINRAMDGIALALRESQATVTSRIDLVLFEINRGKRNAKSDD